MEQKMPKVGIGVIVYRNGKVLLGRRKGSHGAGDWCFPGGHLEYGESFEECALRELKEETGLVGSHPVMAATTNDVMSRDEKHYITIFVRVSDVTGEAKLMEPEKCEEWRWVEWEEMPQPLFMPIKNLIDQGYHPDPSANGKQRMVIAKTKAHLKQKFENEGSGHDWWHIFRVWKTARTIAASEKADMFVVELAALLHDIADWKDHGGDLSAGPKAARAWLTSLSVDEETVKRVETIIGEVSFKGAGVETPTSSIEGSIVQDADRLDAMGAIGIARAFSWGGSRGRLIYDPDKAPTEHGSFEEYKNGGIHTINHFYEKLLLLKDRLNTETGKRMAEKRHRFMERYLEEFYREWSGEDLGQRTTSPKLVRDRIPEIIAANGDRVKTHTLSKAEFLPALTEKLFEEVEEFAASKNVVELADVSEVVRALATEVGSTPEAIEALRVKKHEERGGFSKRIMLDETS